MFVIHQPFKNHLEFQAPFVLYLLADGLYPAGMNTVDSAQTGSIMIPDASHVVDLEVEADEVFQVSYLLKAKCFLPPEDEYTVDLIPLSSHLKRVEHKMNSMQEKQQNNDLRCFLTC